MQPSSGAADESLAPPRFFALGPSPVPNVEAAIRRVKSLHGVPFTLATMRPAFIRGVEHLLLHYSGPAGSALRACGSLRVSGADITILPLGVSLLLLSRQLDTAHPPDVMPTIAELCDAVDDAEGVRLAPGPDPGTFLAPSFELAERLCGADWRVAFCGGRLRVGFSLLWQHDPAAPCPAALSGGEILPEDGELTAPKLGPERTPELRPQTLVPAPSASAGLLTAPSLFSASHAYVGPGARRGPPATHEAITTAAPLPAGFDPRGLLGRSPDADKQPDAHESRGFLAGKAEASSLSRRDAPLARRGDGVDREPERSRMYPPYAGDRRFDEGGASGREDRHDYSARRAPDFWDQCRRGRSAARDGDMYPATWTHDPSAHFEGPGQRASSWALPPSFHRSRSRSRDTSRDSHQRAGNYSANYMPGLSRTPYVSDVPSTIRQTWGSPISFCIIVKKFPCEVSITDTTRLLATHGRLRQLALGREPCKGSYRSLCVAYASTGEANTALAAIDGSKVANHLVYAAARHYNRTWPPPYMSSCEYVSDELLAECNARATQLRAGKAGTTTAQVDASMGSAPLPDPATSTHDAPDAASSGVIPPRASSALPTAPPHRPASVAKGLGAAAPSRNSFGLPDPRSSYRLLIGNLSRDVLPISLRGMLETWGPLEMLAMQVRAVWEAWRR